MLYMVVRDYGVYVGVWCTGYIYSGGGFAFPLQRLPPSYNLGYVKYESKCHGGDRLSRWRNALGP